MIQWPRQFVDVVIHAPTQKPNTQIFGHGLHIKNAPQPIEQLSEEAQKARNKNLSGF
jgi:hypothetical protein